MFVVASLFGLRIRKHDAVQRRSLRNWSKDTCRCNPSLLLANSNGNFNSGGFASIDTINTLNGTALTAADTVTMTMTVDAVTHTESSEIRSRGIEFGMAGGTVLDGGDETTSGNNLILAFSIDYTLAKRLAGL